MITIKELNNKELNRCNSCSLHTSSMLKEIDEIMGSKVADRIFELSFKHCNNTLCVKLCNECLKDLYDKLDSVMIIERCK